MGFDEVKAEMGYTLLFIENDIKVVLKIPKTPVCYTLLFIENRLRTTAAERIDM